MALSRIDVEAIEVQLLLEALFQRSGYEFRDFARTTMHRRIRECLPEFGVSTISQLQGIVLWNPERLQRLVERLTVNVTAMFRDPEFYAALSMRVLTKLMDRPFVRLWTAGCATGEEVYSLAILLEEIGMGRRSRIYATDLNPAALEVARIGWYPLEAMRDYTRNYQRFGGQRSFSDYYEVTRGGAALSPHLKENVVWAQHDLGTGGSFNEFDVILCRNVLIYFNRPMQDRVHRLLFESLKPDGVLAIGRNESLLSTPHERNYEPVDPVAKIYRLARASHLSIDSWTHSEATGHR